MKLHKPVHSPQVSTKATPVQDTGTLNVMSSEAPVQRQENRTGMPDNLKTGIENLSGMDMGDVKVHYNSAEPGRLNAHAYAQGTDIHIASGQERHLPHEAWHVVQQKQGRVRPTMQMKGKVNVNDDTGLEKEADTMGMKALQTKSWDTGVQKSLNLGSSFADTLQRKSDITHGGKKNDCGISIEAYIDSQDVPVGKSPPSSRPNWWGGLKGLSPEIKNFAENYLVQGHLLNHHVGGPDVMENLTPITGSANTTMLNFFEKSVKDSVTKGHDVVYHIAATYHHSAAPTADEIAGSNLDSTQKQTLDKSGYLSYFCDWIYAHYDIYDHVGDKAKLGTPKTGSKGLWVKNESAEKKGTF
jgi:hypothetical protein